MNPREDPKFTTPQGHRATRAPYSDTERGERGERPNDNWEDWPVTNPEPIGNMTAPQAQKVRKP
jgi:hypothetical protein